MGVCSSSEKAARAREAAVLQMQRETLTAEKRRLEEVALAQHWAEKRLQEEQRQKEAVDKWRREQHLKTEKELQRKMEELKMQQRLQNEQRQILQHQQLTALAVENTWESMSVRQTVPVQQRVLPASGAGNFFLKGSEPLSVTPNNANEYNRTRDTRSVDPPGYAEKFPRKPPSGRHGSGKLLSKIDTMPPHFQRKYHAENGLDMPLGGPISGFANNSFTDDWDGSTVTFFELIYFLTRKIL